MFGAHGRSRPFHWIYEGSVLRHAMLDLVGELGIDVFAVIGIAATQHDLEMERARCLRELFRNVSGTDIDWQERSLLANAVTSHGCIDSHSSRGYNWSDCRPSAHEPRLPQSPEASLAPPGLYFDGLKTPEALLVCRIRRDLTRHTRLGD